MKSLLKSLVYPLAIGFWVFTAGCDQAANFGPVQQIAGETQEQGSDKNNNNGDNSSEEDPGPQQPGAFSLTNASASPNQVSVSWGTSANATNYTVLRGANANDISMPVTGCMDISSTSCVDNGVTSGATYYYRVRARNAAGVMLSSNSLSATIPAPPGAFSMVTVVGGNNQATISWQPASGAVNYTVLRGTTAASISTAVASCTNVAATSCVDTGVANGSMYFYRVRAANGAGATLSTNSLSVTLLGPPGDFAFTSAVINANQVTFTWSPSQFAASYTLLRGTTANTATTPVGGCTDITATTCVDRTVANGGTFFYRVRATNAVGSNLTMISAAVPLLGPPQAFTLRSAVGARSLVTVGWNPSQYAASYTVLRGTAADAVSTPVTGCIDLASTALSCQDSSVTNGTTYYYRVRAQNVLASIMSSDTLSATPMGVKVADVQMGIDYACALFVDGVVKCWGRATNPLATQSIGDQPGEMGANLAALNFGGAAARQISASISPHACALLDNGEVACWGSNSVGQLGLGTFGDQSPDRPLQRVNLGTGVRATYVAAGPAKSCAVVTDGRIKCWGDTGLDGYVANNSANRGDQPGEMGDALPYLMHPNGLKARKVTAGYGHICGFYDDNSVRCWGATTYGRIGVYTSMPIPLDFGSAVIKDIASGWDRACAVSVDGNVFCLMFGFHDPNAPIPRYNLGQGVRAETVSLGAWNVCAVLASGQTQCSGSNIFNAALAIGDRAGLLGLADNQCDIRAPDSSGIVAVGNFPATKVAAGISNSCVLSAAGTVKCWGSNITGALGLGDTRARGCRPQDMGNFLPLVDL